MIHSHIDSLLKFRSLTRINLFYHLPSLPKKPSSPRTLTLKIEMGTQSSHTKRPMCLNCSKPTQICLCNRLKTPVLQNSVAVTILQHKLEMKHPLNSTRIATLGLKNVSVVSVSDVNFQARFFIYFLALGKAGVNDMEEERSDGCEFVGGKRKWDFVGRSISACELGKISNIEVLSDSPEDERAVSFDFSSDPRERIDFDTVTESRFCNDNLYPLPNNSNFPADNGLHSEYVAIDFTIGKYGAISSFLNRKKSPNWCEKENHFDDIWVSVAGFGRMGNGFIVKKLQKKQLNGTVEYEEFDEYELTIPPGSVLLFPSEESVGIEDINFEVKNLIVLDGTWAKAKRMYNENPWLKILPHLKLDLDNLSLYSEVRHQPKAGYLSTIESVVYALKAFGEDSEKLDGLLEVFESMVGDQRRCKDERLSGVNRNRLNR